MENKASTSLAYKGFIEIKLNYKGKQISILRHNDGTEYLKKTFAQILTGNYSAQQHLPQKLDLEYQLTDGSWISYLQGKVDLTAKRPYRYGTDWYASFTALLSSDNLQDIVEEESATKFRFALTTNNLSLYNNSSETFAYVDITPDILCKIVPGSQAIVTWNMQILNISEYEAEEVTT